MLSFHRDKEISDPFLRCPSRSFINDIHQPSINSILNLLSQVQIHIFPNLTPASRPAAFLEDLEWPEAGAEKLSPVT